MRSGNSDRTKRTALGDERETSSQRGMVESDSNSPHVQQCEAAQYRQFSTRTGRQNNDQHTATASELAQRTGSECLERWQAQPVQTASKKARQAAWPFPPSQTSALFPSKTSTATLAQESVLGIHAVSTHIASLVSASTKTANSSNTLPFLISHFTQFSCATLSSHTGQVIMRNKIPGLLLRHRFLLHTVLAFAASHLEYLQNTSNGQCPTSRLAATASWHSQRGLRLYGDKISWYQAKSTSTQKIQDADMWFSLLSGENTSNASAEERDDMDAMVACCVMLTSLFFHCPWDTESQAEVSWTKSILPMPEGSAQTSQPGSIFDELPQLHSHDRNTAPSCGETIRHLNSKSHTTISPAWQDFVSGQTCVVTKPVPGTQQVNWLTTITGMAILLSLPSFQKNLQDSIWLPFFQEANDQHYPQLEGLCTDVEDTLASISNLPTPSERAASNNIKSLQGSSAAKFGARLNCSNIQDPGLEYNFVPKFSSPTNMKLPHLHCLSSIFAQSSSTQLRREHQLMHPVISHLIYLISLDPADLNNFSPIISFPSRLPSDFPRLFASASTADFVLCPLMVKEKDQPTSPDYSTNSSSSYASPTSIPTPCVFNHVAMPSRETTSFDVPSNDLYGAFANTMPIPPPSKFTAYAQNPEQASSLYTPELGLAAFNYDFNFSGDVSYLSAQPPSMQTAAVNPAFITNPSMPDTGHRIKTAPVPPVPILPLLLLGYWFTTLAVVPHWWCAERGKLESRVVTEALTLAVREMETTGCGRLGMDPELELQRAVRGAVGEYLDWRRRMMGCTTVGD